MTDKYCLKVNRDDIVYRMGKPCQYYPKTVKEAKQMIKQQCMKFDTLKDVRTSMRLEGWSKKQQEQIYKWTENICEDKFAMWKKEINK